MRNKNRKPVSLLPGFFLLSALLILLFPLGRLPVTGSQDSDKKELLHCPGNPELAVGSGNQDDFTTLQSVRRYLAAHVTYPESSLEAGHSGLVELFARVGHQGIINEIHKQRPDGNYMEVHEIVISAERPAGIEIIESSRHEELVCEARRVIRLLPSLDMPEVFGGLLKFSFRFVLQSDD